MKRETSMEEFERVFRNSWKKAKELGITRKDVEDAIREVRAEKRKNNF